MRLSPGAAARSWPHLPRRSARLRLTVLYGGLFLACGAVLLAVTYVLVERAIDPANLSGLSRVDQPRGLSALPAGQLNPLEVMLAKAIAATDLRQVLIQAPIALAVVTGVAILLGWIVAGRILRPLATITAAARRISASNLNERLRLHGPDDELKALGDTLNDLFARLEASFEAQRHFVASASHELRTPLTRERAMLQVALDDPATTSQTWRDTAREVLASNTEQEELIESLLALASSEGGIGQREAVDLAASVGAALIAASAESARLGLHVKANTLAASLHGDPTLVDRLVANLVDNAVRHNIPGGSVHVTTGTTGGRAVLSVTSTGPVIPPAQVGRLFQPFQRLGGRGGHHGDGHGLGLSIVRAIAGAHGLASGPVPCPAEAWPSTSPSPAGRSPRRRRQPGKPRRPGGGQQVRTSHSADRDQQSRMGRLAMHVSTPRTP